MTDLVVRQHRPVRFGVAVVLASMLTAILTWFLLDHAHWALIQGRLQVSKEQQQLWNANRSLEQTAAALRERVMALERTASVDKQTETYLQSEIRDLQEELFRLKGELAFYERIMETGVRAKGLDARDIYVRRLGSPNSYRVKLVLTNVSDKDAEISGTIGIFIEGRQNGASRILSVREVSSNPALDLVYKFRNFKRFDADLQLPPGFTPQRVRVELEPNGQKASRITKTFDWPATAN